ncbi:hypothetical protein SAMN05660461_2473 [Chitinophaga ginsengisegetis]|jgi:hypothetical protein
MQK